MKSRHLILLFSQIFFLLFAVSGFCGNNADIKKITDLSSIYDSRFPVLYGTTIVWQAKGGLSGATSGTDDWEVFLYDTANQTVTQLTDNNNDDISPQTDGDYVVWQKYVNGENNQIFLYKVQGDNPAGGSMISPAGTADNTAPKISSGKVVWEAQTIEDSFQPGQILLYDTASQAGPTVISDPEEDCSDPRISDNYVTWTKDLVVDDETFTQESYVYDLTTKSQAKESAASTLTGLQNSSADGLQRVVSRYDGDDNEILLYTRSDGYVQLTDNFTNDSNPVVNQNHVTWIEDNNIYVTDIAQFMRVPISDTVSRQTGFTAKWVSPSGGIDAYYLEVSTDPEFKNSSTLNIGDTTEYDVEGLSPGTTYYYRVKAVINGSETAYSKTASVTLERPASETQHTAGTDQNQDATTSSDDNATNGVTTSGGSNPDNASQPTHSDTTDSLDAGNDAATTFPDELDAAVYNPVDSTDQTDAGARENIVKIIQSTQTSGASTKFVSEFGKVKINSTWTTVLFSKQFTHPVVAIISPNTNEMKFYSVRLRNLHAKGFEVRLLPWNKVDKTPETITISYIVMEKGHFTLSGGTEIDAGTFIGSNRLNQVPFNAPFNSKPTVITSIISTSDENAVTGQIHDPEKTHFSYRLKSLATGAENHAPELVSFIAWQKGNGNFSLLPHKAAVNSSPMDFRTNQQELMNAGGHPTPKNSETEISAQEKQSQKKDRTKKLVLIGGCLGLFQAASFFLFKISPWQIVKKLLLLTRLLG